MKSNISIRKADVNDIMTFYGGFRRPEIIEAYGAFQDNRPIAICGIIREPTDFGTLFEDSGRVIGFLDAESNLRKIGFRAVRAMLAFMVTRDHDIYVQADTNNHPEAERLMRVLGFTPTDETETDARNTDKKMRIWRWRHLAQ